MKQITNGKSRLWNWLCVLPWFDEIFLWSRVGFFCTYTIIRWFHGIFMTHCNPMASQIFYDFFFSIFILLYWLDKTLKRMAYSSTYLASKSVLQDQYFVSSAFSSLQATFATWMIAWKCHRVQHKFVTNLAFKCFQFFRKKLCNEVVLSRNKIFSKLRWSW